MRIALIVALLVTASCHDTKWAPWRKWCLDSQDTLSKLDGELEHATTCAQLGTAFDAAKTAIAALPQDISRTDQLTKAGQTVRGVPELLDKQRCTDDKDAAAKIAPARAAVHDAMQAAVSACHEATK